MFKYSSLHHFFKKSHPTVSHSSLYLLKSSYAVVKHPTLHSEINPNHLKDNGFLVSNKEKEKYLFYMAFHDGGNEKITNKSILNQNNPGSVLINRSRQTIYKIYRPETREEKAARKKLFMEEIGIKINPKGVIGRGGFGKVCICQNLITGEFHAVKIIKKNQIFPSIFQSWPHEIEFLKQQNLLIDCIEIEDKFYVIEKLIDGTNPLNSLQEIAHNSEDDRIIIRTLFQLLKKMTDAVAECHQHKWIHGDISPDNFLYAPKEDQMYLIDFGLATKLPDGCDAMYQLFPFGKDSFIAPEFLRGGLHGYYSDIYALGVCFNRMIACLRYKMSINFQFVAALKELSNKMINTEPQNRPKLSFIKDELISLMEEALEEEKTWKKQKIL